jgi:Zn-dependent alcohol dehydrogenase
VITWAAIPSSSPGQYEVVEIEVDEPQDEEILVKMVASGPCHSDYHSVAGDRPSAMGVRVVRGVVVFD